ncbi:unnamed protein product [Symbiodinium sp. CCMP2456]|nr:unnamed protein product [Symbiodinium sp. CCMP2456]
MASRLLPALLPAVLAFFPVPPEQTEEQLSLFEKTTAAAKEASEAATPKVLEFFSSPEFRGVLHECCPDVAALPSQELLERFRAEARVAELAHAFPAEFPAFWKNLYDDITEGELGGLSWLANQFQFELIHNMTVEYDAVYTYGQEHVFGSKPFAGKRPTWPEAANRLIYVAHNMRRLDTGAPAAFGDITVVFNTSHVRKAVLITAYDSGWYAMSCVNREIVPKQPTRPLNCSAWPPSAVGTLDHFDHLILPNLQVPYNSSATNKTWMDGVRTLWSRGLSAVPYEDLPGLTEDDMAMYMEADIFANPRFPHAVKHIIGNFPALFGTDDGRRLQRIAAERSWPLFWAVGDGKLTHLAIDTNPTPYRCNERFADPAVGTITNASIPWASEQVFDKVWADVQLERSKRNITEADVTRWWANISSSVLRVAPLTAASCVDVDHCVAVAVGSGDCICHPETRILIA